MRCFHPIRLKNSEGINVDVPCGKCSACDSNRIDEWKLRAGIERKYSFNAFFITLTYSDENVPKNSAGSPTLKKSDYQDFLKRLRGYLQREEQKAIEKEKMYLMKEKGLLRYVLCGEYGTNYKRPHYHAMLFNLPNYSDKLSDIEYARECIQKAWGLGFIQIGLLNEGGIDYVVSYILQKRGVDLDCYKSIQAPFMECSRKPGIGYKYIHKMYNWHRQETKSIIDHTFFEGRRHRMPRFFKEKLFTIEERRLQSESNYQIALIEERKRWETLLEKKEILEQVELQQELAQNRKMYKKKNGKLKN